MLTLHGYAAACVGRAVMTMSVFRGAGKPILRKCRNGSAETNERDGASNYQFGAYFLALRRLPGSRFGNDSFSSLVHAVKSTTAEAISDGTMNLRFVTKERTTSADDDKRLEWIVTRDRTRSNCNQR